MHDHRECQIFHMPKQRHISCNKTRNLINPKYKHAPGKSLKFCESKTIINKRRNMKKYTITEIKVISDTLSQ